LNAHYRYIHTKTLTPCVNTVAFSRDGKTLASASGDRTVKVWDAGSGTVLQTFHIGAIVHDLSFSKDGTSLQTERGSLPISVDALADDTPPNSLQLPSSILVQDQWVCRRTKRILWLPPEHRPHRIAVYGGVVGFGYTSGRVTMTEFAL
jgi:WD40 repeat protein